MRALSIRQPYAELRIAGDLSRPLRAVEGGGYYHVLTAPMCDAEPGKSVMTPFIPPLIE
jgi:hypothetical protein